MRRAIMSLAMMLLASPVFAHNLILEAYPFGDEIAGEAFFSDGVMVGKTVVEIFGPDGEKIGEATTDDHGSFTFTPTQRVDHILRVDAGAGHVAEVRIPAGGLPGGVSDAAASAGQNTGPVPVADTASAPAIDAAPASRIGEAVRDQIRPMRQELAVYAARSSYPVILGGIGYIVGLAGLAYLLMALRRRRAVRSA